MAGRFRQEAEMADAKRDPRKVAARMVRKDRAVAMTMYPKVAAQQFAYLASRYFPQVKSVGAA